MQGLYKPLNLGLRGAADTLSLVNHRYFEYAKDITLGIRAAAFLLPTIVNVSKLVREKEGLDGNETCKSVKENKRSFRLKVLSHSVLGVVQCVWFASYFAGKHLSPHSWVNRFAEATGPLSNNLFLLAGSHQFLYRLTDTWFEDKPLNLKTTGALVLDLFQAYNVRNPLPFVNAIPIQQITGLTSVSLQFWSWATKTK